MNIIYFHTHDLGRFCEPYGYNIPSPNLARFAREGVLFRNAFSAAPTCSPSRAALLTGQYPHECGMFGLTNGGWVLNDYSRHLAAFLGRNGFETAIAGCQHEVMFNPQGYQTLPYEHKLNLDPNTAHGDRLTTTTEAIRFLSQPRRRPFFLSVGHGYTHRGDWKAVREQTEPVWGPVDWRYVRPLPPHPDVPVAREEAAVFANAVRYLDEQFGQVMQAVRDNGLAEDTLVLFTTDHGIGLPDIKAQLKDWGTGVALIARGPRGWSGGKVIDAMVHQMDVYPTLCDLLGLEAPPWLQGVSLGPLVDGTADNIHEAIYTEQNYHLEYKALRAVRTERYKYIRRIGPPQKRNIYSADGGLIHKYWMAHGWGEQDLPEEQLYDLVFDPNEAADLASSPQCAGVLAELRKKLDDWMEATGDPARNGSIPAPPVG